MLTDRVYKAIIFDLIVAPAYRQRGIGRRLMDWILRHPTVAGVRHVELYCLPEMLSFYERWDFTDRLDNIVLLRRQNGG